MHTPRMRTEAAIMRTGARTLGFIDEKERENAIVFSRLGAPTDWLDNCWQTSSCKEPKAKDSNMVTVLAVGVTCRPRRNRPELVGSNKHDGCMEAPSHTWPPAEYSCIQYSCIQLYTVPAHAQ